MKNEKLKLSGINVRNLESNRPLLDPFTKIFLDLQLVAAFYLFFIIRVSLRNAFRNQISASDRSTDQLALVRGSSLKAL